MATPQQAPVPSQDELLSDLYLALCEQLDWLTGEGKFLDIRPPDASELRAEVQRGIEEIERRIDDADLLKVVRADFERTQDLLRRDPAQDPDMAGFRDYLEEQGLRYADSAYQG